MLIIFFAYVLKAINNSDDGNDLAFIKIFTKHFNKNNVYIFFFMICLLGVKWDLLGNFSKTPSLVSIILNFPFYFIILGLVLALVFFLFRKWTLIDFQGFHFHFKGKNFYSLIEHISTAFVIDMCFRVAMYSMVSSLVFACFIYLVNKGDNNRGLSKFTSFVD